MYASPSACHSASAYQIASKSDRPRRSYDYDVISIFQDGGHGIAILLPVSVFAISLIWKSWCIPNFGEISQTTAEILLLPISENKRPLCWNFISGSDFYACVAICMSFFISLPNFVQTEPSATKVIRSYSFFKMTAISHIELS